MDKGVIYTITNTLTGSKYIGATQRYDARKLEHLRELRADRHSNMNLQKDFNFFGKNVFKFSIIEEIIGTKELFKKETDLIRNSDCSNTYNISIGNSDILARHPNKEEIYKRRSGEGNPNWKGGVSKSECSVCGKEIREGALNCSECHFKQRDVSGKNNPFYGKTHSKEVRKKLSQNRLGKKSYNSRPVIVKGVRYETVGEAARQLKVHRATLEYWLTNPRPKYKEYYYEEEL